MVKEWDELQTCQYMLTNHSHVHVQYDSSDILIQFGYFLTTHHGHYYNLLYTIAPISKHKRKSSGETQRDNRKY